MSAVPHIPVLRRGRPYQSLDTFNVSNHRNGEVVAQVTRNVYDTQQRHLLIPAGSRVLGRIDNQVGLGFAATLGTTVIAFQHIGGESGLIFMLPIYIYLFVTALGTDYNILMIARLREEAQEGRDPHEAAAQAVTHAGPTIAAAGIILAGTFASLMLGDTGTGKEFAALTSIEETAGVPEAMEMVRLLVTGHEAVARTARAAFPAAEW